VTTPGPSPTGLARLTDLGRLVRYGIAGGLSALTHLGTLALLVELAGMRPVIGSTIGFLLSIAVSYGLQRTWVFASRNRHRTLLPRFLTVTAAALLLNTVVLHVGTEVLEVHYAAVQVVAIVLIPLSNYLLNSLWTFR
jgi:putative flippase GtrA